MQMSSQNYRKMKSQKCQCFEPKQIFAILIECLHSKSDRFVFAFSHIVIFSV